MLKIIPLVQAESLGGNNLPKSSPWFESSGSLNGTQVINDVTSLLFTIAAVSCLVFLIWGGIDFIISGGDKSKADSARQRMMYAIIGMIVVASSFAVWKLVMEIVGISELKVPG